MHSLMDQQKKYQTYEDIMKDDEAGQGYDIRQTHRKQLKIDYFSKECSEILTKFLYVSGDQIAANLEVLEEN